jgi:hypothetical protein
MWTVEASDVRAYGRQPGGAHFTRLVNDCLLALSQQIGIPISELNLSVRTIVADGGVDALITGQSATDHTGWFNCPTVWQFKAEDLGHISEADMRKEVNKEYCKQKLQAGYGYRLVVCDEPIPRSLDQKKDILRNVIAEINPNGPSPTIITATELAIILASFPSLILKYFVPSLGSMALHINNWKQNITSETKYVEMQPSRDIFTRIQQHVDLGNSVPDAVFTLQGEAGVGKTRLVYEALASHPQVRNLVLYTDDESNALGLVQMLTSHPTARAVLVADECSIDYRMRLSSRLSGFSDRIRVVAIHNQGSRENYMGEAWLTKLTDEQVGQVLESTFPHIPHEVRRAYAELSKGFIRLAVDLCRTHGTSDQLARPVQLRIRDYYRSRLEPQKLKFIEAVALFDRLGWNKELKWQLETTCLLLGLDPNEFITIMKEVRHSPGFLVLAGRYVYVTPEIIAQVAFDEAWMKWAEDAPEDFLQSIPDELLTSFLIRVSRSAQQEVRTLVGDFFRRWATSLSGDSLADLETTQRLISLMETDLDLFLPVLNRILGESTLEQLKNITGESYSGWGSRRYLVWFVERVAAFPELFGVAENILFILARAETEHGIGNNATGIWQGLFGIFLSGTATPFTERLSILEERLLGYSGVEFVWKAFDSVFVSHATRSVGPAVVAGRIPPADWKPHNQSELIGSYRAAIELLGRLLLSHNPVLTRNAEEQLHLHAGFFLQSGLLPYVSKVFPTEDSSDETRIAFYQAIRRLQDIGISIDKESGLWLESLLSQGTHGKMLELLSQDLFMLRTSDKQYEAYITEMGRLAESFLMDDSLFNEELEWLLSDKARGVVVLGNEMGKRDTKGIKLNRIITEAVRRNSTGLLRGYISALVEHGETAIELVGTVFDSLSEASPKVAFDLLLSGGKRIQALEHALFLINRKLIPVNYLRALIHEFNDFESVMCLVEFLLDHEEELGSEAMPVALEWIYSFFHFGDVHQTADTSELRNKALDILEHSDVKSTMDVHYWTELATNLRAVNPERITQMTLMKMITEYSTSHAIQPLVGKLVYEYPDIVVHALGNIIMDDSLGINFLVGHFRDLISALPPELMIEWLSDVGDVAAERIARHVPPPTLENGVPVVPKLAYFLLSKFGHNDRVFHEFCAGVHSFQLYVGDISSQREREAEIGRKFLNHPLDRIREWADMEIRESLADAERWREFNEEHGL